MPEERERIARLEQQITELFGDIADRKHEEERTRDRLHKVEGLLGMLVDQQQQNRAQEASQYRRMQLWLQALTVTVGIAGFALTLAVVLTHH